MAFRTAFSASPGVGLKIAYTLEMPEKDFEARVRALEADPLYAPLRAAGVLVLDPFPGAFFAARRNAGRELGPAAVSELPTLLDGQGDLAQLIERVGQERFEDCFLQGDAMTDEARARTCGITLQDARRLREFVDRLYIQAEVGGAAPSAAPPKVFSAVAGIEVRDGRPVLAFFHREIWKGRYKVDEERLRLFRDTLSPKEQRKAVSLARTFAFLERRKSTLYRALEVILEMQAGFLVSGKPEDRRPLTQSELSSRLDSLPSVIYRLVSNKSVRLPWGLEVPLKSLLPNEKSLARDRLHELALAKPGLSDEALRREMTRIFGTSPSRRSIAHYRKDLRLGSSGKRPSLRENDLE
jgi:hypothetical protein